MISKAPKFKPRFRLHPVAILNSQRLRRSLADTYDQKSFYKYAIGLILLLLSIGSLYYTDKLVEELEQREEREVQLYAEGLRYVFNSPFDENFNVVYQVIQDAVNFYQIPAIYVNENNLANQYINISFPKKISPQEKERIIQEKLADMKLEHPPIPVELGKNRTGYIYYSNSFLLTQLRYYPFLQLSVMLFIGYLAYLAFSSERKAEQNRVWVGLAKETAHQLGTPLSSLMAWVEYFRSDPAIDPSIAEEIEKDVIRLEMITTRFSNIGSVPTLKEEPVSEIVANFIDYLEKRVSSKVKFSVYNQLAKEQTVLLNKNLFEWVIENICKNAVDAMGGIGEIHVTLQAPPLMKEVWIDIRDTGKGMSKANMNKIFNPGFSTKKRGWGLGLTLAKRIIENYHLGKLYVKSSEIGKGTTFRISLRATIIE
ncbi:sensor histidine kinase [Dyadobacter sediminis]|uniref:histidine kinase n=1 Tax=Dyadobacter sediminis TaxID=1493691 RepID=A0A5R9KI99_9BACT|nr:HAMP domain-containing sensor histidine kinase [Dyadobacter sediminis]TLU95938.1 HAMP domain-containing histidine kinase [Dyadobacter sediminis]GGB77891.1 two-component sensor histidine kinase [Dyadobacter sediminis]